MPLVYDDRGGLFVDASVGGAPARLILDTGASRSTLSEGFVRELGLATRDGGDVEGTAGVVSAREATTQLEIPGIDALRIDFLVYGFGSYDPRCRGILGYELLHRAPFQIRYREQALVWNAALPAERLPLALDGRIPRVAVRVNGEPLELRIDTGATLPPSPTAYVNLSAWQAEHLGLTGHPAKVFTATGTGGATLELPVHRLESIQVGSALLSDAFAIVQPRIGYFAREDAVGFLGNSVLDGLDPYLDYAGRSFAVAF